jgi:hypothetical protein
MWEEKFWILFVTWSCMKEVEKGNSVPCFFYEYSALLCKLFQGTTRTECPKILIAYVS